MFFERTSAQSISSQSPDFLAQFASLSSRQVGLPRWCRDGVGEWDLTSELYHILLYNHNRHGWGEYALVIDGGGRCCGWYLKLVVSGTVMLMSVFEEKWAVVVCLSPCRITFWNKFISHFSDVSRLLAWFHVQVRTVAVERGYEQMTATTWRRGNAMPYFHDNIESALLGSANGLMCATRGWECAQSGPFSVLLQDYALRSFVRVEWLQINFLWLASDTRGPLLFLVILECLCTEQAVFFAIICSLRYCTVEAVNARTTPQNFRFCDFAARDSYGHVKLQNSS